MEPAVANARQHQIETRATVLRVLNGLHREIGDLLHDLEGRTIEETSPLTVQEALDNMGTDLAIARVATFRWVANAEVTHAR